MSIRNATLWPRWNDISRTERLSEILFGLIIVLTFTVTLPFTIGDGVTVQGVLLAALSCNIAWGIIDGTMSIIFTTATRGRRRNFLQAIKDKTPDEQNRLVKEWWQEEISTVTLPDKTANSLTDFFISLPSRPIPLIQRDDIGIAFAIATLVIFATFPPVIPFIFIDDVGLAVRASNGIAILMMVWIGYQLDIHMGEQKVLMRWAVPLIGVVMVGAAIVLGG
jgi:hypothetical protein